MAHMSRRSLRELFCLAKFWLEGPPASKNILALKWNFLISCSGHLSKFTVRYLYLIHIQDCTSMFADAR